MAKTLKQIADEIGISKQRVYRFVKQEGIIGTHQENQTIYYDEQAEQTIKVAFQFEPHHEAVSDAVAQSMERNRTEIFGVHHKSGKNKGWSVCVQLFL